MPNGISKAVAEFRFRLHHGGVPAVWRWTKDRLQDRQLDRQFGIGTWRRRSAEELGFDSPELVNYQAIPYGDLHEILGSLSIEANDVLLDLGSGAGRIVCVAATYPFGSVIGVEISAELCAIAENNAESVSDKFRCPDVQILNYDAQEYRVPPAVNVVVLFNPFSGGVLHEALKRIKESAQKNPRRIQLLFYGTVSTAGFEEAMQAHKWLSLQGETALSTGAVVLRYIADVSRDCFEKG